MNKSHLFRRLLCLVLLVALFSSIAEAQSPKPPYVKLKSGNVIEGTSIRSKMDGSIVIETAMGSQTFPADQVAEAVAATPPEFVEAQKLFQAAKYPEAAALLEKVGTNYKNLGWDIQAIRLLAQVKIKSGDAAGAIAAYERLFRSSPNAESDPATKLGYLEALIADKQYDRLERKLDEFASSGPRDLAAKAQILRGDAKAAQGLLDDAVLDYLRTAHFFKKESEYAAEGYLKAGQVLEQLNDNGRAKALYQRLIEEYPGSTAAAVARGKT